MREKGREEGRGNGKNGGRGAVKKRGEGDEGWGEERGTTDIQLRLQLCLSFVRGADVHQKPLRLCPNAIYTHTSSQRVLKAADVLTISIHTKSLHKKSHVKVAITSASPLGKVLGTLTDNSVSRCHWAMKSNLLVCASKVNHFYNFFFIGWSGELQMEQVGDGCSSSFWCVFGRIFGFQTKAFQ